MIFTESNRVLQKRKKRNRLASVQIESDHVYSSWFGHKAALFFWILFSTVYTCAGIDLRFYRLLQL